MSINLQKGQKINLSKDNGESLTTIMVGLGWDPIKQRKGLFSFNYDIDCDASAILCGADGRIVQGFATDALVYYGNRTGAAGAVQHQGDNLTGDGDGDDEQIFVDLANIPENIHKLVFVVNIYDAVHRKQHFGMIENAFIRVVNYATGEEFCNFNLSNDFSGMTALIAGEIYRHNGSWKFNAIGQATKDASVKDLLDRYR